ncbi:hypothetical protein B296_00057568 [Ensete ventricosum]|uniref:CASP-like protein n=1 Tax=Ensete ventricosum TaxID=4639 RepID=A0A426XQJ4_ENSVE|nr:hypothetical protein B296_00057568 [Ensete ventricosum]
MSLFPSHRKCCPTQCSSSPTIFFLTRVRMESQFRPGFDGTQGYNEGSPPSSTNLPGYILRVLAVVFTLISTVVMGAAKEIVTLLIRDPLTNETTTLMATVKSTYSAGYVLRNSQRGGLVLVGDRAGDIDGEESWVRRDAVRTRRGRPGHAGSSLLRQRRGDGDQRGGRERPGKLGRMGPDLRRGQQVLHARQRRHRRVHTCVRSLPSAGLVGDDCSQEEVLLSSETHVA